MAHQFPNQLLDRGDNGRRVYNSIMENASSKVVFRLTHEENLSVMAKWLFMGVMNPDEIKHEMYSTKVMEYREEMRTSRSRSRGTSEGGGEFTGSTGSKGTGGSVSNDGENDASSWNESDAESGGTSSTWTSSDSEGETESSVLIPVLGKELSHVQFRTLEEQLFRSMAVLFDQKERHGVGRLVGMSAPVSIQTPTVDKLPTSAARTQRYLERCYQKLPFALPTATAHKQLADRATNFADSLFREMAATPAALKRKITPAKSATK
jgi:hypothetical protein